MNGAYSAEMGLVLKIAAGVVLAAIAISLLFKVSLTANSGGSLSGDPLLWDENRASAVLGDSGWMATRAGKYDAYPSCYGVSDTQTDAFDRTVYTRFRCVLTSPVNGSVVGRVWIETTGASQFSVYDLKTWSAPGAAVT